MRCGVVKGIELQGAHKFFADMDYTHNSNEAHKGVSGKGLFRRRKRRLFCSLVEPDSERWRPTLDYSFHLTHHASRITHHAPAPAPTAPPFSTNRTGCDYIGPDAII